MAINGLPSTIVNGIKYFRAKSVAAALGYRCPKDACRRHVDAGHRALFRDLQPPGTTLDYNTATAFYISAAGVQQLALKSRMPASLAFAESLGLDVATKYTHKEQEIVQHLRVFLEELRVASEYQKTVGRYRVDLYLPDHRMALEIDEFGHRHRDQAYEQCREDYIRRALGCDFLRVDPDALDFNAFKLCGQVAARILGSTTKQACQSHAQRTAKRPFRIAKQRKRTRVVHSIKGTTSHWSCRRKRSLVAFSVSTVSG